MGLIWDDTPAPQYPARVVEREGVWEVTFWDLPEILYTDPTLDGAIAGARPALAQALRRRAAEGKTFPYASKPESLTGEVLWVSVEMKNSPGPEEQGPIEDE